MKTFLCPPVALRLKLDSLQEVKWSGLCSLLCPSSSCSCPWPLGSKLPCHPSFPRMCQRSSLPPLVHLHLVFPLLQMLSKLFHIAESLFSFRSWFNPSKKSSSLPCLFNLLPICLALALWSYSLPVMWLLAAHTLICLVHYCTSTT